MISDAIDLVEQLVAIASVSPMRPDIAEEFVGGGEACGFLESLLTSLGLAVWRQPVLPGRDNLFAQLDGDVPPAEGGRVVLFDAHQDTVPVDGMTIEPFRPERQGKRIYGRGACVVKGGMAAVLTAVARLARQRPGPLPTIVLGFTVDEENGFRGVSRLTEKWFCSDPLFHPRRPDAVIVVEPTGLNVVVAHKGVVRWRAHTRGRAAHSSCPQSGENAIYKMARVVDAVEKYATLLAGGVGHEHCGHATVSIGTISGGSAVNTVPDRCTIEIDQRPLPGEVLTVAREQLLHHLPFDAEFGLENEPPYLQGPPLSGCHNDPLAKQLCVIVRGVTGDCRLAGRPCCTNAPFYAEAGIPTVVFGPGHLEQAHAADEWISVDQLRQATEIVYRFCQAFALSSAY